MATANAGVDRALSNAMAEIERMEGDKAQQAGELIRQAQALLSTDAQKPGESGAAKGVEGEQPSNSQQRTSTQQRQETPR